MKKNIASCLRLSLLIALFAFAQTPVPVAQAQAGTPQLILTKTVDDNVTVAQVGDVIRYRIRWECSSLTTACGQMEITDVLQAGLTYLPPPNSSVPGGFQIAYDGGTRTVTITKTDNNLLDGTQFDAVIAVSVNNDLRPLPTTINNTVNGRIDPPGPVGWTIATPASAPPITIGAVSPSWQLTKTRVAPIIEPTVDTDVTYSLQLCPVPPPTGGIAALTNIVLSDTLPANAVFVSASNGGTFSAGVVTWPAVAGPLYPPDCITRLVTMRYPSPPFNITDTLTNSANVIAGYTDSSGNPCPNCFAPPTTQLTHAIDPIADVPTYSKGDAGDPVGITGTARFILNLNTNLTNYPANNVTLIDNLPGQLQVTSVTSGAWSANFDNVRAYVEYSTNYGNTWTAFPGQPVSYNTNATYTAPVANITNVRWRFEYDPERDGTYAPGLPYVWQFSSNPEIRVTPRATATVADPPSGVLMPAATVGSTYTNCVQVTRVGQAGPVTDPCSNQDMTVRGDYASLQVSKNETPGTPWDEWDDPNINTFTSDATILPGDTLRYVLTVDLTERSSAPLINPTVQDTLPTDLVFVRQGDIRVNGSLLSTAYPAATFTFTRSGPNPGAGQTLLWEINNLTLPQQALSSQVLTLEFFARIPRGQLPGTRTNTLFVVTDSLDVLCEIGTQLTDGSDVDGDGNTAEAACSNTDIYVVDRSAALRGEKWIRSVAAVNSQVVDSTTFLPASCPDGGTSGLPGSSNTFTRFPCISQAYPEGALNPGQYTAPPPGAADLDDFEYQLRIFNDGNVPMLNYVLYDILPFYGDRGSGGTLFNSPRSSEFRPVMTGPIQFLGGAGLVAGNFTIEYNLTTNPCRPEVFNQSGGNVPAGCNDTWFTAAGIGDWSTVRSYRIRLNSGFTIAPYAEGDPTNVVRFGMPMSIPADAPVVGAFNNDDAQSREIAWNSFAHVGSYLDLSSTVRDLLASEPRKVGITIPERFSIGNRVWRDSDNSGDINAPDDLTPGIAGVTVNLYQDANNDGVPDGAAISTTITDIGGYYLFSNLPAGNYLVGIPASNFGAGQPLENLRSSTGTPASVTYTNPPDANPDRSDHGRDPASVGQEVYSPTINLAASAEPTAESDLSANDRDGPAGTRRGLNGERDNNSDLTVDFGFFGGTDIPFSLGNHVWKDNGQTGPGVFNYALRNDGIRQVTEPPVVGALVRLYRDGNNNGIPEPAEMIRTDLTDVNGFYLFDNLDPGPYYVEVAASNFQTGGPLVGWYSSQVTGTEDVGVAGNPNIPNMDSDDNGIDSEFPESTSIFSGLIVLTRGVNEPVGETFLSGEADPGAPANAGYSPTGWDGPGSIGRFGETDVTSNVTIDFGFIPPMSLGNRVWIDEGAGTTPFRAGYDNGLQDGAEVGVGGVSVQLWRDTDSTPGLQTATDTLMQTTTTDASGYYLFDRLQPANNYYVHIPASNFAGGGPLVNYVSSTDASQVTPPADDTEDRDDNGIDNLPPATNGVTSPQIVMSYNGEPLTPANETDINTSGAYGPNNVGNYGQEDGDSNLTIDFGFVRPPRSLGNFLWIDANNNGALDVGETPVPSGVRLSLYQDSDGNSQPDDLGIIGNNTDDWLAYDLTDANGYYLFDKLPPGRYVVGVDYTNFAVAGLLEGYASSKGYVDNAANNTDSRDNGVDRLQMGNPALSPYGILSTSIDLRTTPVNAPTGETGSGDISVAAGFNPTAGDGTNSRGRYAETDANSDLTIDFGFFIPMSLGNRVFRDDGTGGGTYNDGIMNGGELPVANVRVELWRDSNTDGIPDAGGFVDFDTTDAGGYYLFDDLAPGSYVVVIPASNFTGAGPLVGYNTSTPTGTENGGVAGNPYTPNTDRDDNGLNVGTAPTVGGVRSGTITLAYTTEATGETELSGQADPGSPANLAFDPTGWDGPLSRGRWEERDNNSNLTIDFGFIPVFSLGNRVWFDTNNNSLRAGAEVGIANVRVQLFDSTGTTEIPVGPDGILYTADDAAGGMLTTAAPNPVGYYLFNNLPAGDYIVRIPASNFGAGQPLNNKWSSGTTISNAGVISETAAPDADTVATDSDDNGTRNGATGNVDSLPVTLGPLSTPEPTGETDLNGGVQGQPDAQANMTVDFGFYSMTLGNLVWLDNGAGAGGVANNGLRTAGEPGIAGVTVQLWSQDLSTQLATATTTGGGIYTFPGLVAGNYIVRIPASNFNAGGPLQNYRSSTGTVPPGTAYEPAPNPDTTTVDNDDNGTETGGRLGAGGYVQTSAFAMTPTAEQTTTNATGLTTENRVDFGFIELVAIGNRVWFDTGAGAFYNNGILNAGEVGVNNVTVQLYTSAGVEVPVGPDGILNTADDALGGIQTSGGGYYRFDRLLPGTYYVLIPATEFQAGGDLFGYVSSLGAGANETSDQNVDENGIDVATLTTTGIRTQNYTLLPNTEQTLEDQSNYTGTLDDNNVNFTADFGFTQLVAIGNRVWIDNGSGGGTPDDGIQNGTEAGINGVTVELYTSANVLVATTTTATVAGQPGTYQFDNLNPGDYYVSIPASMFDAALPSPLQGYVSSTGNGANETSDQDVDENGIDVTTLPTTGIRTPVYTLTVGGETTADDETTYTGYLADANVNFTADFGFLQKVALGNVVWLDNGSGGGTANDGRRNGAEPGVAGVDLQLFRVGETPGVTPPFRTTTTDANGFYFFDELPPGQYFVFIPAAEFQAGGPLENYSSSTGNGTDETSDQDVDENGIDDIAAAANGIRSTPYDLQPDTEPTGEGQTNYTGVLDDNNVNFTADFGFFYPFSIGNRVFLDDGTGGGTLNNGIMDGGELPIANVRVELWQDTNGTAGLQVGSDSLLRFDITDAGGYYLFDGLISGEYYIHIPAGNFTGAGVLVGFYNSTPTGTEGVGVAGNPYTPNTDRDDNGVYNARPDLNGISSGPIILSTSNEPTGETELSSDTGSAPGNNPTVDDGPNSRGRNGERDNDSNLTVDFGFVPLTNLVSLGSTVFLDGNDNGIQDVGEAGISGVGIELYRSGQTPGVDTPILTDTTDLNGDYFFGGLTAGSYIVYIPTPPASAPLSSSPGVTDTADNSQDSDDNGTQSASGQPVTSPVIVLTVDGETTTEPGQGGTQDDADDNNGDMTVDFGFRGPLADLELDKSVNNATPLVATNIDFTVTVTNQGGPDTATNVQVTDVLPGGFTYISHTVTLGTFDNVTGVWDVGTLLVDQTATLTITVSVNLTGPYTNDSEITRVDQVDPDSTPNNGSTTEDDDDRVPVTPTQNNPSLGKTVSNSNQAFTSGTDVAIGEIVEYTVTVNVPPGVFANARLVDTMERGLSFMTCSSITASNAALTTDVAGSFTGACSTPTVEAVDDSGNPSVITVDVGRRVTYNLGTLTNSSGVDQTLTFVYRTVVLDSAANISGVTLDNSAVWTSDSGTQPPVTASVRIVEPELSISKTANTSLVSAGSEVTITLEIQHTAASNTNAYDAVLTDALPAELELVPGTLECVSGAQDATTCSYDAGTRTIRAVWDAFTRTGGNGLVTFRVGVVSLPSSGVSNTANVAWTSLPGVPPNGPGLPVGQQNANAFSTERDYDPASQIDVYGASDTLVLNVFGSNNTNGRASALLPATGFAPNVVTDLGNVQKETYVQTAGLTVEIPSLGINIPIVGVPLKNGEWNVSWLGNQAGWLEGSAFPSWSGNSVLTSHVYDSNGLPGPFVNLSRLKYGDKIIVHAYGRKYTYEVRANAVVEPNDASALKHEEKAWLTLVTCKEYEEKTNTYKKRVVVRAVLVGVDWE